MTEIGPIWERAALSTASSDIVITDSFPHNFSNRLQIFHSGLCLRGIASVLAGILIALGRARVSPAVHPASLLSLYGW